MRLREKARLYVVLIMRRYVRVHQRLSDFRRALALTTYAVAALAGYWLTFLFRWGFGWSSEIRHVFVLSVPLYVAAVLIAAAAFKLSTQRWRFIGAGDLMRLIGAMTLSSALFGAATWLVHWPVFVPLPYTLVAALLTANGIAGVWLAYRLLYEQQRSLIGGRGNRRVIIIGAGDAGSMLAREMLRGRTGYVPVAFFDDEPRMWHATVHGVQVRGATSQLAKLAPPLNAHEAVIAVPSASPETMRRIVAACEQADLPYRILPGIKSVLEGEVNLAQIRKVRIEDLLGREPVDLQLPELSEDLRGRSVLITGAAGSIGSELARQVALHQPDVLILFDQSETALFYLERELRESHPDSQMIFVVGDILDRPIVERVFRDYAPSRVYHAAAYKHVSMMEMNPREAVRNNVLGTYLIAEAAGQFEVEKFILVSTDKAVRPTSVMGASKRLAEVAIIELQQRYADTCFAAVRFGNVLGSSGSVVPIFKEQLEAGKPLTVTHPEVTRYFMTIPEAVHLILQASLLPNMHGRIAMLEMGEPISIHELAKNLLRLSGKSWKRGRDIVFTGLRRGEKLHEELVGPDELTSPTPIPKVRLVQSSNMSLASIENLVDQLEAAFAESSDGAVTTSLKALFPDLHVKPGKVRREQLSSIAVNELPDRVDMPLPPLEVGRGPR